MVDVGAVVDVENVDDAEGFVDAVHDPVGPAPGTMAAGQRSEQRLANAMRGGGQSGVTELQHSGGDGLRQPVGDRAAGCGLEADLVPGCGLGFHAPVARRLARSWRTVARSAPGSPRPSAARLSEMRGAGALSPRISR